MKKIIIVAAVAVVAVVVIGLLVVSFSLDGLVKRGVETVGPRITKVDVKLDAVNLSPFSGAGKIKGLLVGNPEGYKTPSAIKVGSATLGVQPGSLLSDKIIINEINVQGPEITFETDLKGNNLSKLLANINETTGGGKSGTVESQEPKAARKLQVNEFVITGGKINVNVTTLGGKSVVVPLPEIRMKDMGMGPEGITAANLTKQVLETVLNKSIEAAGAAAADLGKAALNDLSGQAQKAVGEKINEGLGGLLKKKK